MSSKIFDESIRDLYIKDEYIKKNPSLHEEDSEWKIHKIIPLVDMLIKKNYINSYEINLLDVGGGAGLILKEISNYIESFYKIRVNRYALDLSPGMLAVQGKNNPNAQLLNEDICRTSLRNKEIDIVLMIDVIEHIPNSAKALQELGRISRFAIFKVPLEDSLISNIWNFLKQGKPRQNAIDTIGHINIYNSINLKRLIEKNGGSILNSYFTNVYEYFLKNELYAKRMNKKGKAINIIASYIFIVSPNICSYIFTDFLMILVSYNERAACDMARHRMSPK
ncbi:class I SAM-dependent methyltransferase [Methanothrix soehngenii]|uniref:class I SAM-dependent methyltransferase n=1 Tax=Methanothrix soehngenii TaxID=2223 RepID=UPI002353A94B|nr:class I SAM-dependent methyltransferase [Methanothrix soehngenii]